MIEGLGTDLVSVDRVQKIYLKWGSRWVDSLFTPQESLYLLDCKEPAQRLAGQFAAKEAIAKALGTGFGAHLSWKEIEVLRNQQGAPFVRLPPHFKGKILLSISHEKGFAMATALWLTEGVN